MQKKLILTFIVFFAALSAPAVFAQPKVTVSGYVHDSSTGETLIGAAVMLKGYSTGAVSNEFGFYSLTLPKGEVSLEYSFIGYRPETLSLNLQKDTLVSVRLIPGEGLSASTVSASREAGIGSAYMGALEIPQDAIKNAPAILGENDVIKVIQTMPGVQPGMEGFSGLHVRGGGADENLMMLDGTALYNVSHALGLFSVFTPEAVKKITLHKGAYPARYGGRVSSIIDVRTIDGNENKLRGSLSVGMIADKFHLDGPLDDRTVFSLSMRGMHTALLDRIIKWAGSPANYAFYDINGKIARRLGDRDRVFLGLYHGRDYMHVDYTEHDELSDSRETYRMNVPMRWGNSVATFRWNHMFSNRLFSNFSVYGNHYMMRINADEHDICVYHDGGTTSSEYHYRYRSGIDDLGSRADFDFTVSPALLLRFGGEAINHLFRPEAQRTSVKESEDGQVTDESSANNKASRRISGWEYAVYTEGDISVRDRLDIVPGMRLSLFTVRGRTYLSPEPRISVRYDFGGGFSGKAAYSRMSQYVHQLSTGTLSLPTDLWVPITENISPVTSDTWSAGGYFNISSGWELSLEAYWKELRNVLEYKDGRSAFSGSASWESNVEEGRGRSKGVELYVRKTAGKTTGSVSYTLSKTDRWFPDGSINGGKSFPFKYDRRNVLNISVNRRLGKRTDFGLNWACMSGYYITVPTRQTIIIPPDGSDYCEVDYVTSRNNWKTPPSHHLDLSFNIHKKLRHGERTWNISIYNIYNAHNPNWCTFDPRSTTVLRTMPDGTEAEVHEEIPSVSVRTFLTVLPSFSYTWKF